MSKLEVGDETLTWPSVNSFDGEISCTSCSWRDGARTERGNGESLKPRTQGSLSDEESLSLWYDLVEDNCFMVLKEC